MEEGLYEAEDWEKQQGENTLERTANIGRQALGYRKRRDLSDASAKDRRNHMRFIRKLGQDALSTQSRPSPLPQEISEDDLQQENIAWERRKQEILEKLNGNLDTEKLQSFFDNMDDTDLVSSTRLINASKWSNDIVETACDYLLSQFRSASDEKKMKIAETLLSELFSRNRYVAHVLQQHLHSLIHLSTHQLLFRGKCTCQLGYLSVIKFLAAKSPQQMTEFKFCYRFSSLLMMNLHLAASIIQLTFRKRNFSKYYKMYDRLNAQKSQCGEFLSSQVSRELFEGQYAMKLRRVLRIWRPMQRNRNSNPSWQSSPHMEEKYVGLGLEIVDLLLSASDVNLAATSRRDVIEAQLLILLPQFLSQELHDTLRITCSQIMYSLTQSVYSLSSVLSLNITASCMKILISQHETIPLDMTKTLYGVIRNVANHNAGLDRALAKYDYVQPSNHESPEINYLKHVSLNNFEERIWVQALGSSPFIRHLLNTIMASQNLSILQISLACLSTLSCGSCRYRVIEEIGSMSGKFVFRLIDLLEESSLSANSLAVFLQLSTDPAGRQCLLSSSIDDALKSLLADGPAYSNLAYHYGIYIICALYRIDQCRPYNPTSIVTSLQKIVNVQVAVIEELVRTIHDLHNPLKSVSLVEMLNSTPVTGRMVEISAIACECGAKHLAGYLSNPSDLEYYRSLSPQEFCARALILNCLSSTTGTCILISTKSSLRFLSHCVFYSSYLFQGKPMGHKKAKLVLQSALHAFQALRNICAASQSAEIPSSLIDINIELDILEASAFFIKTLSIFHAGLMDDLKSIQQSVGVSAIKFMDAFMYSLFDHPCNRLRLFDHPVNSCLLVILMPIFFEFKSSFVNLCLL